MSTELHPVLSIRLYKDNKCFGSGVAQLLHQVEAHASLRGAARSMNMAYSKAWTVMRKCEEELGFPLLIYSTGGHHGGGATLTEEAKKLLAAYERYSQQLRETADQLFAKHFQEFL